MTKAQLASAICYREGKKSQVSRGNALEVLSVIEGLIAEDHAKNPAPRYTRVELALKKGIMAKVKKLKAEAKKNAKL